MTQNKDINEIKEVIDEVEENNQLIIIEENEIEVKEEIEEIFPPLPPPPPPIGIPPPPPPTPLTIPRYREGNINSMTSLTPKHENKQESGNVLSIDELINQRTQLRETKTEEKSKILNHSTELELKLKRRVDSKHELLNSEMLKLNSLIDEIKSNPSFELLEQTVTLITFLQNNHRQVEGHNDWRSLVIHIIHRVFISLRELKITKERIQLLIDTTKQKKDKISIENLSRAVFDYFRDFKIHYSAISDQLLHSPLDYKLNIQFTLLFEDALPVLFEAFNTYFQFTEEKVSMIYQSTRSDKITNSTQKISSFDKKFRIGNAISLINSLFDLGLALISHLRYSKQTILAITNTTSNSKKFLLNFMQEEYIEIDLKMEKTIGLIYRIARDFPDLFEISSISIYKFERFNKSSLTSPLNLIQEESPTVNNNNNNNNNDNNNSEIILEEMEEEEEEEEEEDIHEKMGDELLIGCSLNSIEKVKIVIDQAKEKQLDISKITNRVDCFDNTPLLQSIVRGNLELFFYLIENGADLKFIDSQSNNYIHQVCAQPINNHSEEMIKMLDELIANNVEVNQPNSNSLSPLHLACANLNSSLIRYLMKHNCDFTLKEKFKRTPFQNFLIKLREKNSFQYSEADFLSLRESIGLTPLSNSQNQSNKSHKPSVSSSPLNSSSSLPPLVSISNIDRFFNNDLFSDISFNISGKVIKAHKLILSCRCDYFRALFEGSFADFNKKEMIIDDVSYDAFLSVMRYIYCGEVLLVQSDSGISSLLNSLHAATKYMVDGMIIEIEKQLTKAISLENCFAIFSDAAFLQLSSLMRSSIAFILQNYHEIGEYDDQYSILDQILHIVDQNLLSL